MIDMAMTMHTYGLTSSLSVCNHAKNLTAKKNVVCVCDDAVSAVINNTYVDDWCDSTNDEKHALNIVREVTQLLYSGGFKLTKFASNNKQVLQSKDKCDLAPGLRDLNLHMSKFPTIKTLGVFWDMDSDKDCFKARVTVNNRSVHTRRTCLSDASRLYDPLGLYQIYLIPIKKVLQEFAK